MTFYYYDVSPAPKTAAGDHGVTLNWGDDLYVAEEATIRTGGAGAYGVYATGSVSMTILGSVVSTSMTGVHLSAGSSIAYIGDNGTVFGSRFGISAQGDDTRISNDGLLRSAALGIELQGSRNVILNSGYISANTGIDSNGQVAVTNTGVVDALNIVADLSEDADQFINRGLIRGNLIYMGGGDDLFDGRGGEYNGMIWLGTGHDTAYGGESNEVFIPEDGDDLIDGGGGSDTFSSLFLTSIRVDLSKSGAQDTGKGIFTLINIENVQGADGDDTIVGNSSVNVLTGNRGNDILEGGLGDDVIDGGQDNDTAVYSGSAGATVNLSLATVQNTNGYGWDRLVDIENLSGGSGADFFIGNAANNVLSGNAGNDFLDGGDGNDELNGGAGNDTYVIKTFGDKIVESSGIDTVVVTGNGWGVYTLGQNGANVENLVLDDSCDVIIILGDRAGNDLRGNSLGNTIKSNAGNDTLNGRHGNDVLYGGIGEDKFVFDSSLSSTANKDRIMDWDYRSDTIQLENAVFKSLKKTGLLSKGSFVLGSKALQADDFVGYNKVTGDVWYDANGNKAGGQVVFANIGKNKAIFHTDFIVI